MFATLCLFIVLCSWSLLTGRYGGPDEPSHVIRAAAVAGGDLTGRSAPGMDDGFRLVDVPVALGSGDPSCYRHDPRVTPGCAVPATTPPTVTVATAAGTYPPHYYALVGGMARLFGGAAEPMTYRLAGDVLVAVVLGCIVVRLSRWRSRAAASLLLAALPPAAWFLFGVVNPNSLEIALLALTWVGVAEFAMQEPTGRVSSSTVAAWSFAAAVLVRPVAVLAAPTIAVVVLLSTTPEQRRVGPRGRRLAMVASPIAAACAFTGIWQLLLTPATDDSRTASSIPLAEALAKAVSATNDTVRESVGSLGWLEFSAPNVAQIGWWLVVGVAAMASCTRARFARSFALAAITIVAIPVAFEVLMYRRVGFVWQGRYSIAAALGAVTVGAIAVADPLTDDHSPRRALRHLRVAARLAPLVGVAGLLITQWAAARRYTVGVDGPWSMAGADAWHPRLDTWLLIAISACALAGLACWWRLSNAATAGSDDVAEHVDDDVRRTAEVERVDPAAAAELHVGQIGHG